MSENEKLVERLRAPIRLGGTTSEDSYEVYDDLRLAAATALTAAEARIGALEEVVAAVIEDVGERTKAGMTWGLQGHPTMSPKSMFMLTSTLSALGGNDDR